MIKTSSKQSSPKSGKKSELTKARVDASMKDLTINLERDKLKDSKKSDIVNASNTIADTIDSLENCTQAILTLDKAIDKVGEGELSINKQIQSICFDSKGKIDEFGIDSIVDYATRLKNQTEGNSEHKNFNKLNVLRVQFASAMKWAKENDFIENHDRLSLVGMGKKMTQSPDTDNPYKELTEGQKAEQEKANAKAEKSKARVILDEHISWFVSLTDKEFEKYSKERSEFKLMTNDKATKKIITDKTTIVDGVTYFKK